MSPQPPESHPQGQYRIGPHLVDFTHHRIQTPEGVHKLPARPMQLFFLLVQQQGEALSREAIIDRLWEGNIYVGKKAVTDAVWRLRKALEDDRDQPQFIETIPKKGYRLISPARPVTPTYPAKRRWLQAAGIAVALSLIALVAASIRLDPGEKTPLPLPVTPVTIDSGVEHDAAICHEGRLLAYAWLQDDRTSRIFVKSLQDPDLPPSPVSYSRGWQRFPTWAPDNRRLAFLVADPESEVAMVIVDRETKHHRIALDSGILFSRIEWSPNSEQIAYSRYDRESETTGIAVLDVNSGSSSFVSERQVSAHLSDYDVHWSPDGDNLCFCRQKDDGTELILADLNGHVQTLTWVEDQIKGVDWMPSGEAIVFSSARSPGDLQTALLWSYHLQRGTIEPLGSTTQMIILPEIMPDGRQAMVYTSQPTQDIVGLDLERSGRIQYTIASNHYDRDPHYSPQHERLTFASTRTGNAEIWTASVDGSHPKQLTDLERKAAFPRWSPSAEQIVFVALNPQKTARTLYLFDVARGSTRLVKDDGAYYVCPAWARDGKSLYCVRMRDHLLNLWNLPLDGSPGRAVATRNGFYGQESWDGDTVYFTKDREHGLWCIPKRGGQERLLIDWKGQNGLGWLVREDDILFLSAHPGGQHLVSFDLGSEQSRIVADLGSHFSLANRPISWVEQGNLLLAGRITEDQGDLGLIPLN